MATGWAQSNTGLYQKITVGGGATYGWTLTTSSKWKNFDAASQGGNYFAQSQNVNESVISTYTWDTNQAFFISWFVHAKETPGAEDGTRLEFGWGDPAGTSVTSCRIFPSGRVQVYRNDVQVYDGDGWTQGETAPQKTKKGSTGQDTSMTFCGYWVEPFDLGLLITCTSHGKSLHVRFEDIDPDTVLPAPIPSAQFWWWVRKATGATVNPQCTVQAAPVQYLTTPYVISDVITLDFVPDASITPEFSYITSGTVPVTYELLNEAGTAAWDGTSNTLRVKVYLYTGVSTASGALYSVELEWPGATITTDGSDQVDLNALQDEEEDDQGSFMLESLSFSKPDQIGGASASLVMRNPERVDLKQSADVVRSVSNRVFSLQWGRASRENYLIDGRTGSPKVTRGINNDVEKLAIQIDDARKALERYRFRTKKNLGGLTLSDALKYLFKVAGTFTDADMDYIEASTFTLPVDNAASDEASCVIKVGETPMEWIQRIMDDYSPLDFCDIVPMKGGIYPVYRTLYSA
jgi:hypothetical protein